MSTPTAKDLLAQADRMMRQRTPEELPVLTDLVIEEIEIPSLGDHVNDVLPTAARPAQTVLPKQPPSPVVRPNPAPPAVSARAPSAALPTGSLAGAQQRATSPAPAPSRTDDVFGMRPRMPHDAPAPTPINSPPTTAQATANVREQFNAQLVAKLEELQHSVFSQVMQQLELHAAGALKTHLRETLEPALMDIARDIADQVAEDTSAQVRDVVSKAVDSEISRLREQLSKRRNNPDHRS